jgi:hypothetical protein
MEAELLRQLGREFMRDIQEVMPLAQRGRQHLVLLLYTYRAILVQIRCASSASKAEEVHPDEFLCEATNRLFWRLVIPNYALVTRLETREALARENGGSPRSGDPFVFQNMLTVELSSLKDVRRVMQQVQHMEASVACDWPSVELVLAEGDRITLPLQPRPLRSDAEIGEIALQQEDVLQGLMSGLTSAVQHPDSAANWSDLRSALSEERRCCRRQEVSEPHLDLLHAGEKTIEVFEVERKEPLGRGWVTPYIIVDNELKWRWVDVFGNKHPHLISASIEEISSCREPPCALDRNLRATGEWRVDKECTDEEGWRYGLAWRSSKWDPAPKLFHVLRKRKWVRTYT